MTGVRHLYLQAPPRLGLRPDEDEQWNESIGQELRQSRAKGLLSSPLNTLLVGGGPSTYISADLPGRIRDLLGGSLLEGVEEWTVEASPEEVTPELIREWRRSGVTRPHLTLLSLSGTTLVSLGRRHDHDAGRRAAELLRLSGFPSWGVDVLFGLTEEWAADPRGTVEELVRLEIPHISLYEFVSDDGSGLESRASSAPRSEEEKAEEYLQLANFLVHEGYQPYEMTGFALPGHASLHAVAILQGKSYLGVGPRAESFIDDRLSRNLEDWAEYSRTLSEGRNPKVESALLDPDEIHFLQIWAGLKLAAGLRRSELSEAGQLLGDRWVRDGLGRDDSERVALSLEGWLRLDGLAMEMARVERPV